MRDVRAVATAALRGTARRAAKAPLPLKERQLQELFVEQLSAAIAEEVGSATVRTNFGIKLEDWDGVGPVDVAVCSEDSEPIAFFELKCGSGTLFNCVWDVAKMARAVQLQRTPEAFLVAAAPDSDWAGVPGSEFFSTKVWATWSDLLERHRKAWDFWKKDVKTHPLALPRIIRTTAVAQAPFALQGSNWELRCAEVRHASQDVIDVATGMTLAR